MSTKAADRHDALFRLYEMMEPEPLAPIEPEKEHRKGLALRCAGLCLALATVVAPALPITQFGAHESTNNLQGIHHSMAEEQKRQQQLLAVDTLSPAVLMGTPHTPEDIQRANNNKATNDLLADSALRAEEGLGGIIGGALLIGAISATWRRRKAIWEAMVKGAKATRQAWHNFNEPLGPPPQPEPAYSASDELGLILPKSAEPGASEAFASELQRGIPDGLDSSLAVGFY